VGAKLGFVNLAGDALRAGGVDCRVEAYGYAAMSKPGRLLARSRSVSPDVLVLQLGHRESLTTLRSHVWQRLGLRAPKSAPSLQRSYVPRPDCQLRDGVLWKLKSGGKRVLDAALGHSLLDANAFREQLEECLAQVREAGVPSVVVMSALPCADPVTLSYRRDLLPVYRAAARANRFEFIDVVRLAGEASMDWFADPVHLSRVGHAKIAAEVSQAVGRVLLQPAGWAR
jgi:hypothetical protein